MKNGRTFTSGKDFYGGGFSVFFLEGFDGHLLHALFTNGLQHCTKRDVSKHLAKLITMYRSRFEYPHKTLRVDKNVSSPILSI